VEVRGSLLPGVDWLVRKQITDNAKYPVAP